MKKNSKEQEKNLKDIKGNVNDNKFKSGNMEFKVRRKDLYNLSYNENDINDIKKKIKEVNKDWRIT